MAQTMQLVRPKETSQLTWNSTFPESLQTEVESTLFMKKLLAVSISNILYLRGIFPNDSYQDQSVDGLVIKILSQDCEYEGAKHVINWIKGCYDALEKKYLRQAMIGVYNDKSNPEDIIETYTFCFSFEDQKASLTLQDRSATPSETITNDKTKNATVVLLKSIAKIVNAFRPLPEMSYLTMKLLYYDHTPPEYEPAGFKSCQYNPFNFGNGDDLKIDLGNVGTKYHDLKVKVKTSILPGTDSNNNSSSLLKDVNDDEAEERNDASRTRDIQNAMDVDDDDDQDVHCPCGDKSNDGLMLSCDLCKKWQHGVCFGVFEEDDAPSDHVCDMCDDQNSNVCGDKIMVKLSPQKRSELAIMRRALNHCEMSPKPTITINELIKKLDVEKHIAKNVLQKLEKEKYVESGKGRFKGRKVIMKKRISEDGFKNYFEVNENSTIFGFATIFDPPSPTKTKLSDIASSPADIDSLTSRTDSLSFSCPTTVGRKRKARNSITDDGSSIIQSSVSRKRISST